MHLERHGFGRHQSAFQVSVHRKLKSKTLHSIPPPPRGYKPHSYLPVFSGVKKAMEAEDWLRTYPTRLMARSSLLSISPSTRNQPSSLGLGNRGAVALLSCFLYEEDNMKVETVLSVPHHESGFTRLHKYNA